MLATLRQPADGSGGRARDLAGAHLERGVAGLVVGHVDDAVIGPVEGGEGRLGNVVDMDAVEHLSWLHDPPCGSGAQILGLANAGGDTINSIKAANEFGLTPKVKMAGLLVYINDIHALGLKETQGMYLTDFWYWDANDANRAWSKRFEEKFPGQKPSMNQAADYSAAAFYLKAVKATGSDETDTVMKWMKSNKVDDFFGEGGYVREDGRMIHDMNLMQVKSPAESKYPWDYYKIVKTVPGDQAFNPLSESKCPLVTQK